MRTTMVALLSVLLSVSAIGAPLKVLNFNTMCDLCGIGKKFGPWKARFNNLVDTAKRHDPDLISFQEFRTAAQIKRMGKRLNNQYHIVFAKGFPLSWADPALFIRKSRFDVLEKGGGWWGPNFPKFSFGWQVAIPRRVQWVRLKDKADGTEFYFVGTHFDNHSANKEPSAKLMNDWFQKSTIPAIFAGDSNLDLNHPGYSTLLGQGMRSSFDEAASVQILANAPYSNVDPCPDGHRGEGYPSCRIDHVLLTAQAPWKVKSFTTDLIRYRNNSTFVSDHRAVVVELE